MMHDDSERSYGQDALAAESYNPLSDEARRFAEDALPTAAKTWLAPEGMAAPAENAPELAESGRPPL